MRNRSMGEKIYKTVENSGVMNVVAGAFTIAVGVSALVSGILKNMQNF